MARDPSNYDYHEDNQEAFPFYNDEDVRVANRNGFRWGFAACFFTIVVIISSLAVIGYLTDF